MKKQILLIVIFLLLVIPTQAMTVDFVSADMVIGTCSASSEFYVLMTMSMLSTDNDGGNNDWVAMVLYDGYDTPIAVMSIYVHQPYSIYQIPFPFNFVLEVSAQARPFTIKSFNTTALTSLATAPLSPLISSITFDPGDFGVCSSLPDLQPDDNDDTAPHFTDGRINNFDMASPFVVYGHDFEDGRGLVIYSPEGDLLLTVHPDAFAVECTGEVIELASDNGVTLYLLPSCEYQLMARSLDGTKNYILIFNEPYPNTGYTSYEE